MPIFEVTRDLKTSLRGTITALATPFKSSGMFDRDSFDNLIEYQLKAGIGGFVVCGSSGEGVVLSSAEYSEVLRAAKDLVGERATLIAGVVSSSTAHAIELSLVAKKTGYEALLVTSPPYNKPPQSGLLAHFRAIFGEVGLPLIAYNIPGRTGVTITPETIAELAHEGTIVALKDSTSSLEHLIETIRLSPATLSVLSGEDLLVQPMIAAGACGVISASANVVPGHFLALTDAALAGDFSSARNLQANLSPLIRVLFSESNPIPVKAALGLLGIIKCASPRLPLVEASVQTVERIRAELKKLEIRAK